MNNKELGYFLQVCKDKSIRKAAKSLYISPQGLSKSIKNLEDELQTKLFYRTTYGTLLTESGEIVKKYSEKVLKNIEFMNTELNNLNSEIQGKLPIAFGYGIISALTPEFFLNYKNIYPNVDLNIVEHPDILVEESVLKEKSIIGFTIGPIDTSKFDATLIKKHNLKLLVNKNNPLALKKSISFSDLSNESFILVNNEFKTHHNILQKCKDAGFTPKISFDISEISIAHKFCSLNYGVSVTVDYVTNDVKFDNILDLPFEDESCTWEIYMITLKNAKLSVFAKSFINYIKKYLACQTN